MSNPAPEPNNRWSDLVVRLSSAAVMLAVGFWAVWAGRDVFHVFIAVLCGVMVWELVRMLTPDARAIAFQLGALSGAAVLLASYMPAAVAFPVLLAPVLVGVGQIASHKRIFAIYCVLVLLAGYSMLLVRDNSGLVWMLWLVLVVIVTDVAGYFAGKLLGGPKFWPRFSPKKTWSGTVAGWIGAAIVGLIFVTQTGSGYSLVVISVLMSMASQMGDIGESAIKRTVGIKDSSSLIPGHGGLLDRFDGMIGASVFLLLVSIVAGFPPGLG